MKLTYTLFLLSILFTLQACNQEEVSLETSTPQIRLEPDYYTLDNTDFQFQAEAESEGAALVYEWVQLDGPIIAIENNEGQVEIQIPSVDANTQARFQLTVLNEHGNEVSAKTTVHISKNQEDLIEFEQAALADLLLQRDNIVLIPGPKGQNGPVGPQGDPGDQGAPGTLWGADDNAAWLAEIEATQDYQWAEGGITPTDYLEAAFDELDDIQDDVQDLLDIVEDIEVANEGF